MCLIEKFPYPLPPPPSTTVRRYACMALTNLTFGDGKNKALLCSMRGAMEALSVQLRGANEDLVQAAASVLRNLSWRADLASKKTLREVGVSLSLSFSFSFSSLSLSLSLNENVLQT